MKRLSVKGKKILIKSGKYLLTFIFFLFTVAVVSEFISSILKNSQQPEKNIYRNYTPNLERSPKKKLVKKIIKRELTEEELNEILETIEPSFQKAIIDINDLSDIYSNRIKELIMSKQSNIDFFSEEVFAITNTLKYLKYYVFFQKEKIGTDVAAIWNEKMFTAKSLAKEITSEIEDYNSNVSGKINIMKSEIETEIEDIVKEPQFETLDIQNSCEILNSIEKQIDIEINDLVLNHMIEDISYMLVDFLLTGTIVKFILMQSFAIVGISASSTVISVSTFLIGAGIGVTIDFYIQKMSKEKMKKAATELLQRVSYNIVEGKNGLRKNFNNISNKIEHTYMSEALREKIKENLKIKTIVMVEK